MSNTPLKGQIITLGGGGFSEEPDNLLLDSYILNQARQKKPRVCFISTASGDSSGYIDRFYAAFKRFECYPKHLSLFSPPQDDLLAYVLDSDVIYVGGGNTKNLLALWREWKLDIYIKEAVVQGVVLAGISAGAICWFEEGLTDSTGKLGRLDCLGFLRGSCSPHFSSEAGRRTTMGQMVANGAMKPGYGIDDCVALHFVDGIMKSAIRSIKGPRAYHIEVESGHPKEKEIIPIDL